MIKIFETKHYEELICPKHHINLVYRIENNEMIMKCEWCDYTLLLLHDKNGRCRICGN